MFARGGGNFEAAQHAGDFFNTQAGRQRRNARDGLAVVQRAFADLKMLGSLTGHLRQMRHAQHLPVLPQPLEQTPDHFGYTAANAAPDTQYFDDILTYYRQ